MFSFAKALTTVSLVAAVASAITVTSPTKYDTWTSPGTETITWSSVSTDASSIAIILISQDLIITDLSNGNISTSDGTLSVEGTYPVGTNYRVNIVRDSNELSTILAQSDYFNITQGTTTSSATSSSSTTSSGTTSSVSAPVTLSHSSTVSAVITGSAALASASAASASAASASVLANSVPSTTKASAGFRVVPAVGLALVGAFGAYFL